MKAKTKFISFSVSLILILLFLLSPDYLTAIAAEADTTPDGANPFEITLYVLEDWAKEYTSIPTSYPQSFQLDLSGLVNPTFSSENPESVSVSETGLITPAVNFRYWYGYRSYIEPIEGEEPTRITTWYDYSGGAIKVSAHNKTYYIQVNVADYATVFAERIDLYYLNSSYSDYLSVPAACPQSYQIDMPGARSYVSSDSGKVSVTRDGIVTLTKTTWYFYGSMGYSRPIDGQEPGFVEESYSESGGFVIASSDDFSRIYYVNPVNYAAAYTEKIMRDYISANITQSMSTYEKIAVIARFVADKEYDYHYSSAVGMILTGGGDCWASTDTIVQMAQMAGLKGWWRNGNKDPGAGGGHTNAMVSDGSDVYEVEAGYYMSAPRSYHITKRDTLFSYRSKGSGVEVYQYDDVYANLTDTLVIPREINGRSVVSIGDMFGIDYCIQNESRLEKIVIPDTVTSIGKYAFIYCSGIKELTIPASVTYIGENAFAYYENPNDFSVTSNEKFIIRGYKNTAAEQYALDHGMIFEEIHLLLGDVDQSEEVTIDDTVWIARNAAEIEIPFTLRTNTADVDGDGEITLMDATCIQRWLAHLKSVDRIGRPVEAE
ncbi:MAG: leucine-rich repeat protein [Ruminococcus sp.]|nr:leucine-rich repeat protein [Ruminococcus sp.]